MLSSSVAQPSMTYEDLLEAKLKMVKIQDPLSSILTAFVAKLHETSVSEVMKRQIKKRKDLILYFVL